jgi:hypothetical protein
MPSLVMNFFFNYPDSYTSDLEIYLALVIESVIISYLKLFQLTTLPLR